MPEGPLTLMCVHPHPDDESISCGGLLARASDAGVRTVVVTCTGGEAGDNLAGIDLGDDDLTTHRTRELAAALEILGVEAHHQLGYRDSGMAGEPTTDHPDCFHQASLGEAARVLAAIIRAERPDVIVSDDEHGGYGHPDHIKANRVTATATTLAADPDADVAGAPWRARRRFVHSLGRGRLRRVHDALIAAGRSSPFGEAAFYSDDEVPFGLADDELTTELDVRAVLDRKQAAIAAHASQISPDSFFLNVPDQLVGELFGTEQYALREGLPAEGVDRDLFAGLVPRRTSADALRGVMGRFATGVGILTVSVDGLTHGMTVNAVTSVSLDPPLMLVCVERGAEMIGLLEATDAFAVSFLSSDHASLSRRFADAERPRGDAAFTDVPVSYGATGAPLLDDGIGWLECRRWAEYEGGDHTIVVGEVIGLGRRNGRAPLVFLDGDYTTVVP